MEIKDMPIAAIIAGATSLLPLIQDIIGGDKTGMTEEQYNEKWNAVRDHFKNSTAGWKAAEQPS